MRVLIAASSPAVVGALASRLRQEGHEVLLCPRDRDLAGLLHAAGVDLLLLDADQHSLPLILALCRKIRRSHGTRLLLVGQRATCAERAQALEAGADDYIDPTDPEELVARVHVAMRHQRVNQVGDDVSQVTEQWWLDTAGQQLLGERSVRPLSSQEFRLLRYFLRHEGAVLSRKQLLDAVWGPDYVGTDRGVDHFVYFLRRKIEPEPRRPRYLLAKRGGGYCYQRLPSSQV